MHAASTDEIVIAENVDVQNSRTWRWALLGLTLVFSAFASFYYLAIANVTNPVVVIAGLAILWAVWGAATVITLTTRPATPADRLVSTAAPACVVIGAALYFLA